MDTQCTLKDATETYILDNYELGSQDTIDPKQATDLQDTVDKKEGTVKPVLIIKKEDIDLLCYESDTIHSER